LGEAFSRITGRRERNKKREETGGKRRLKGHLEKKLGADEIEFQVKSGRG